MVEDVPYTDFKFVSVPIKHVDYSKLNIANGVIRWPKTLCNLKVKVATRIFKA